MIYRLFLVVCIILTSLSSHAQIDKEFWFAAPYANPSNGRLPVYLRFQAFEEAATVTINIPSNRTFATKTVQIAANGSYSLDISSWIPQIENIPSNTVLNKGLHITATKEISVYYELYGTSAYAPGTNSDIFPLKGRNALGKLFYTPFQTRWDNQVDINAYVSFDIIATQDNTQITITPTKDLVGHSASTPFTITLNKGQTWSGQSPFVDASQRPVGSKIEATKPIAVTVKDDSMLDNYNWDMGGDQIIPVTKLGTEYFVLKHTLAQQIQNDYAYILATQNNTEVFLNSNTTALTTLNAGEQVELPIDSTIYIRSTFPVYIIHVTGFGSELAEAIIPAIACTGSKKVGFIRSNSEDFVLNVLTKKGNEDGFILNGKNTLLTAGDFSIIAGNPNWVFASKSFSIGELPALKANLLSNNKGYFHLSIMNGAYDTGFRYGYFTDFGFVDLGPDTTICAGTPYELSAGIQKDSYAWKPNNETSSSIIAKDSGTYSVTVNKEACTFSDTVHISYFPNQGDIISSKDNDTMCANKTLTIQTNPSYHRFIWSTGQIGNSITVTQPKIYKVFAKNQFGCEATDFIKITVLPIPTGFIRFSPSIAETFCTTDIISLYAPPNFAAYKWFNGDTLQEIHVPKNETGIYWVTVTDSLGCKAPIPLEVDCSTFIEVYNLITPNGDGKNEYFKIKGLVNNTYALKIYNSWGSLVYSNDNYNNIWDAEPLENGVYYFSLIHHKGKRNITGWLHVLD